ncbi:hypothetical protein JTB14_016836 [Gonioctena quinquepunctata]|nr:hypothetical protein JTB14_016836 [Gonioctena quinquepunctata]
MYWMYKFRDVSQDDYDARNKTFLQKNFASISSLLHPIPSAVTMVLASMFAHKIHLRKRLLGTMIATTLAFIVFTCFVEINTDSWQTEFFIFTMIVCLLNNVISILFSISALTLLTKFPKEFIKLNGYGGSISGVVSAVLQIVCLWIGGSRTQVALIYYLCGTTILVVTLILTYLAEYQPMYQFYISDTSEEHMKKPVPTLSDVKELFKRIWLLILPMLVGAPFMGLGSPSITMLMVSEYYEDGGAWSKKYFIPVSTFLLRDISTIVGRFFAKPFITPKNVKWFALVSVIHALGMTPLHIFCNALPRNHLPVLFPHDWQYILLSVVGGAFTGFFGTVHFLSMSNLAGDKTEQGFQLISIVMTVTSIVFSPMNQLWVYIL